MANLGKMLKDEISRLAQKEARSETSLLRKQSAQYRRDVATLKRQVANLQRAVTYLEKQERKRVTSSAPVKAPKGVRYTAKGLKSHREKTGLSAANYALLAGCSALSIYHWESGKATPRPEQQARLIALRGLGVREAQKRLDMLG
jgi:DNA-binding transcriptional regulator YiaG